MVIGGVCEETASLGRLWEAGTGIPVPLLFGDSLNFAWNGADYERSAGKRFLLCLSVGQSVSRLAKSFSLGAPTRHSEESIRKKETSLITNESHRTDKRTALLSFAAVFIRYYSLLRKNGHVAR